MRPLPSDQELAPSLTFPLSKNTSFFLESREERGIYIAVFDYPTVFVPDEAFLTDPPVLRIS